MGLLSVILRRMGPDNMELGPGGRKLNIIIDWIWFSEWSKFTFSNTKLVSIFYTVTEDSPKNLSNDKHLKTDKGISSDRIAPRKKNSNLKPGGLAPGNPGMPGRLGGKGMLGMGGPNPSDFCCRLEGGGGAGFLLSGSGSGVVTSLRS